MLPEEHVTEALHELRHVVINPPHTLKPALQLALPQMLLVLGRGRGKAQSVEAG